MVDRVKPIPLPDMKQMPYSFQEWVRQVTNLLYASSGLISWASVDKTGSNLTDIVTRNHNNLQSIQGGAASDYYHFTLAQHTDLTDAGDSTLHFHASDRARANHTGTQLASTVSDFTEAAQDAIGGMVANSAQVTLTYVDATPSLTADLVANSVTPAYLSGDIFAFAAAQG